MRIPHNAQKAVRPASAPLQNFGTEFDVYWVSKEQSSYFPPAIAPEKKIISSDPGALTRSTDHVDNNKHAKDTPLLARHLGGVRCRHLHPVGRRGHLPARSLVIHVARDHRRRTTPVAAAPLRRSAARPRAALCHRL